MRTNGFLIRKSPDLNLNRSWSSQNLKQIQDKKLFDTILYFTLVCVRQHHQNKFIGGPLKEYENKIMSETIQEQLQLTFSPDFINSKVSLSMSECKSSSHHFIAADQSKVATLPRVSTLAVLPPRSPHNHHWIEGREVI